MISTLVQIFRAIGLFASVLIALMACEVQAQTASVNDIARLLAGMQPSPDSPLLAMTRDRAWQQHANRLNAIFAKVESRQLIRIKAWSQAKLTPPSPVLFYMFSGPDFLYANAFFPNASTYVMSGLEPTGPVPDLTKLSREGRARSFRNIEESLNSILTYSFFQTIDMRRSFATAGLRGTLPIIYVLLARTGKTIREVSPLRLDQSGTAQVDGGADGARTYGVKIDFVGDDERLRTIYYFNVNVDNDGFKASGFARFCESLGTGDAFVKSASYLMHRANFSDVRNFLLEDTRLILQDDSGIPLSRFDQASWRLRPFGHYSGPIALFANRYQPKLTQLFNQRPVESIDFGIGYRWHPQNSSLIVATRTDAATAGAVAGEQSEVVPDKSSTAIGTNRKTHRTVSRHARNRSSVRTRLLVGQRSFWFADW
jgi:hypothetical protein